MIGLDELTKEELISLIRENIPELDEEKVVLKVLRARSDLAWAKATEASNRAIEKNEQIIRLVEPYADGPIKPGVKLRRFPKSVQQEYDMLDEERRVAWKDRDVWYGKYHEAEQKLREFDRSIDQLMEELLGNLAKPK